MDWLHKSSGKFWCSLAREAPGGGSPSLVRARNEFCARWCLIIQQPIPLVPGGRFGQPGTGGVVQDPRCGIRPHMDRGAGGLTGRFPVALENGGAKCHNLQQRRLAGDPSHQSKSGHAGLVSRAVYIEAPLGRTPSPPSRTFSVIGTRCERWTTVSSFVRWFTLVSARTVRLSV